MLAVDVVARKRTKRTPEALPGPTPETKAKLRPDAVRVLYGLGLIDQQQFTAALEIREMWEALMAMHFRRDEGEPGGRARVRHPLDGLNPALQERWMRQFLPWKRNHGGGLSVVWDVVIDGRVPERGDWRLTVLEGALDGWMRMGG